MATTNQKIVAEALHLARKFNFTVGFDYLRENASPRWDKEPMALHAWFINKCLEHNIPSN